MHLNFDLRPPTDGNEPPFILKDITIETDEETENRLHDLCTGNLLDISNPCLDFAQKYKAGEYEDYDKKHLAIIAQIDNFISDIWRTTDSEIESGECSRNIFLLFVRLLGKYIALKLEYEELNAYLSPDCECEP